MNRNSFDRKKEKMLDKIEQTREEESEFGKGCTYCLGLFLAHEANLLGLTPEQITEMDKRHICEIKTGTKNVKGYSYFTALWFNASSDHLYDLEIPDNFPSHIQKRLALLKRRVIHWGHGFAQDCTQKDMMWALQEAKDLLLSIDKWVLNIDTKEAEYL